MVNSLCCFDEDDKEMYVVLLIKPFALWCSRWRCRLGLLRFPIVWHYFVSFSASESLYFTTLFSTTFFKLKFLTHGAPLARGFVLWAQSVQAYGWPSLRLCILVDVYFKFFENRYSECFKTGREDQRFSLQTSTLGLLKLQEWKWSDL